MKRAQAAQMDKSELNFTNASTSKVLLKYHMCPKSSKDLKDGFQNDAGEMALSSGASITLFDIIQKKVNSCCRNKKPDPEVNEYYTESNLYPAYMYDAVMLLNTVMRRFIKYNQRNVHNW